MNTQQKMLYELQRKSKGLAYLLWIIPIIPVHRLYLREYTAAFVLFMLWMASVIYPVVFLWLYVGVGLFELFQLWSSVDEYNARVIKQLNEEGEDK